MHCKGENKIFVDSINKCIPTNTDVGIQHIFPQEAKAFKKVNYKSTYKNHLVRSTIFVASFFVILVFSYLISNAESLSNQLFFNESEKSIGYSDEKQNLAEKAVAGASTYSFTATKNRIEIPKLNIIGNLEYPQHERLVEPLLNKGIVHLPSSAGPGLSGLTIFTAHSSSETVGYYSKIFSNLNKLNNGDIVMLYKENEVLIYKIYKKEIIQGKSEYLRSEKSEEIALITCWPLGTDLKRLVVYGERVK